MPVQIAMPTALRPYVGGSASVQVEGATVREALDALTTNHPKLASHLRDANGKLRSFVNVYLGDEDVRFLPHKEDTPLQGGELLTIVPSIAGGAT